MSRHQFINDCTEPWTVQALCRVLGVSPAGYYQWRQRTTTVPAPWHAAAQEAFSRHARRYDTRRLRAELQAEGHAMSRHALRIWLHRHGLRALSTRPQRPRTTVADPAAVVAENRLLGQPAPVFSHDGRATPTTTPRPKRAGAPLKPNYCPAAVRLPRWKKPSWRSRTTSTRTSTLTAATPPWATARPTNSNTT